MGLVLILLCLAVSFQVGLDRTPAGSGERAGNFPSVASLARFMGGIRQYLAYTFFIKTDELSHVYGNTTEIIPYLRIITYLDPHYIDAYFVLAGLLYDMGREEEALEVNLEGIQANPESADLYFSLGDLMLREKRYPEALEALEKAFSLQPRIISRFTLYKSLIAVYGRLGKEEEARRVYSQLMVGERMRLLSEGLDSERVPELVERINSECQDLLPNGLGD